MSAKQQPCRMPGCEKQGLLALRGRPHVKFCKEHFENRWKKRFSVRALKEIQVTLDEFMKVMVEEDTEPEPQSNTLDEHFGPREAEAA